MSCRRRGAGFPKAPRGHRRGLAIVALAALAGALAGACGREPAAELSPGERAARVQGLMVRGVAHAEIEEWQEAIARFTEAVELGGEDPVLAFDLAVAHLRSGEPETARGWLDKIRESAPETLRARAEYVRGKLALETGDAAAEAAAYRRAMALDPSEAAYPYALSRVVPRLGGDDAEAEYGAMLERALELWPDNARLAAELAQWTLGTDAAGRKRGAELVAGLAVGEPAVQELLERGRQELAADPGRAPVSLRRAINLLRPAKRFQTDSAALEARLALLPLAEPVGEALRAETAAGAPAVSFERAELLPAAPWAAGERVIAVAPFNDAVPAPADAGEGDGERAASEEGAPDAAIAAGVREARLAFLTDRALWLLGRQGGSWERLGEVAGGRVVLAGELDGDGRMELVVLGEGGVALWGRGGGPDGSGRWQELALEPALAAARLRSGLLVDFEHDGDLDLVAVGEDGRLLLATHRGEAGLGAPEPAPLPAGEGGPAEALAVLSADLDGDADQDLLVAGREALRVLANWRQGEFRPGAELALGGAFEGAVTADLDGDGRFDLAAVAGGRLAVWRNHGSRGLMRDEAAEARALELLAGSVGPAGVAGGTAARASGDRAPTAGPTVVRSLAAGDVDLDGSADLLAAYEAAGEGGLVALSGARGPELAEVARFAGAAGALAAAVDLDGDCDADPLLLADGAPVALRAVGGEGQGCLRLVLRGLAGKVPLDGRGARLDVWFGLDRRSRELERPEAVVGLGGRRPAVVEVVWPNGISEYLFEPEPGTTRRIEQELRIEGSCPFLYASDGGRMRFVTDILSLAPLGMLAAPGVYVPADPEEYLRLPGWVASAGAVELRITEELREVAYIDQAELVVVDAPPGVEVYNGERWFPGPVEGLDLRLLGPLEPPAAARDARGRDVLELVAELDDRYLEHSDGERLYQGAATPQHLELELPRRLAETGRVSLVLTGWLHWGNTSTNVARAQDPGGAPVFPYVEVPDGAGGWRRLELDAGLPAGKTKPVVVDLGGAVDPADPRLRITTDFEVYWDRIAVAETLGRPGGGGVGTGAPRIEHHEHRLAPSRATLSYGGFSRWYRPAPNGPYLFDYADRRPYPWRPTGEATAGSSPGPTAGQGEGGSAGAPSAMPTGGGAGALNGGGAGALSGGSDGALSGGGGGTPTGGGVRAIAWQEHEGYYTPFGEVTELVAAIDDRLAVFGSGEELALTFDTAALPALPAGWSRTLFLHSEGWEKDGDPNVACAQTVGPLPSRALAEYPCSGPAGSAAIASSAADGVAGGRWVDRQRLVRRVRAWRPAVTGY